MGSIRSRRAGSITVTNLLGLCIFVILLISFDNEDRIKDREDDGIIAKTII